MHRSPTPPTHPPARRVRQIDWTRWQPTDEATLLFVIADGRILLIRKKRGLGAGKINGPGGKIDPGETPLEAAVREVREEVGVVPRKVSHRGELSFQFVDGYAIHVHVFTASAHEGAARETAEATPLWTALDAIPFEAMWPDDRLWFPMMLRGDRFSGRFIFDGDSMLDHELRVDGGTEE